MARQPTVQPPRTPLGTGEIGNDRPPDHLEPIAHARQQPIELLITQVDLAGEELADARLANPAEARQLRLGGAGLEHHLPQQVTSVRHALTIAKNTMGSALLLARPRVSRPEDHARDPSGRFLLEAFAYVDLGAER